MESDFILDTFMDLDISGDDKICTKRSICDGN